ncbi:hypothetical protein I4U23_007279 [Adineta vaga]|nr:hypothetical protein I4U23_007279 [Adineta vaga]
MHGWIKLMQTIRQTDPPTNNSVRLLSSRTYTNDLTLHEQNLPTQSSIMTTEKTDHLLPISQSMITPIALDSPPNIFDSPSIISLESTPTHIIDDILSIENELLSESRFRHGSIASLEIESTTASLSSISTDSKQSTTTPSRKIIIRKSTKFQEHPLAGKSNEISTPITEDISDDDMPLVDIRKQKMQSTDTLSTPSINDFSIPLATDLQSLPGHIQHEQRDHRFLIYNDIDTLSMHLHACLYVDKQSLSSISSTRQEILQCQNNALTKIFKIYYIKTFRKNLYMEKKMSLIKKDNKKIQPLSLISSPTSTSFKTDWNVNRRNSTSTQRQTPKNCFHILQMQPKKDFSLLNDSLTSTRSTAKTPIEKFELVKDILARTYYPHLHTAIEYSYQFGERSKFPSTNQLISTHDDVIPIKEMPRSPEEFYYDSTTITLKSPPARRDSIVSQASPIVTKTLPQQSINLKKKPSLSSRQVTNHSCNQIEELSPWRIKESVVVLTPAKIPISASIIEKEKLLNTNRKRKSSSTAANAHVVERKKTRMSSSTLVEMIDTIEDISEAESVEDVLPTRLPKQSFIKNGLRSNYYKKSPDEKSKSVNSKTHQRRSRQSSGSLPQFYTGIYESDDDNNTTPHIDYHLPYDIYWHGQQESKQASVINSTLPLSSSSITANIHQTKKKSNKPKQKQPSPYKKLFRNVYSDQLKQSLLTSYSTENAPVCDCKPPGTCEDGVCVNKMIFTECLTSCACGTKCSNQKIRKNQWFKHLEVFDTGKYGQGLRTATPISKGTFLCEYVGEIITDEKFQDRMINLYSKDEHHYTMKLTQNLVIDAYRMGSMARFANHSCSPNCEFEKWTVDGLPRMCMFSLRSIKAGEELTYDYNFKCFNLQAQQPCYCESSKCRGKIGAKQRRTSSSNVTNNTDNHSLSTTMQKLTQREKRMVFQSSIFLLRNLRKIQTKQQSIKMNGNKSPIQTDKQSTMTHFYAQNYYHSNGTNHLSKLSSLRKTPKINHKDMFSLFYNHIRRSHFVKTGRYRHELIDETCYYAQLTQLTIILNELFELILHYKCINDDIKPADALKKCPSKRLHPAYYEIITKPIDLKFIKTKLDNGDYSSFHLFEQDILLLFNNAITYCGANSVEACAVLELQDYFLQTLKIKYKNMLDLFIHMQDEDRHVTNLQTLETFIQYLHDKEVRDGQVRQTVYDIIYNIDDHSNDDSPINYKIVLDSKPNSHRTTKSKTFDGIVHCRCGSVFDDISLVQCYACQLWQHVACVSIGDSSRPYYCFECQPICEHNPSACLKTNVLLTATLSPLQTYDDNHSSYSTLTRSDGFVVRTNESYFVPKQDEKNIDRSLVSPEYDILFVERLWLDDYGVGQAAGYYYIRPNETFHEPNRKFFPNEVFRFPSSNDPLPISSIVRPCFVLDIGTYSRGKPINDNSSRVLSSDLFMCEYRVDKTARTFTRLSKSRNLAINTKSYCFDSYVEKLIVKRDYQPYQKEIPQQSHSHHDYRRRAIGNSIRKKNKKCEERRTRINGIIEKIYCRCHNITSMPNEMKYTIQELFPDKYSSINVNNSHLKPKSAEKINKKRRTISLSSDDDIVELVSDIDCRTSTKKRFTRQSTVSPCKRSETYDLI